MIIDFTTLNTGDWIAIGIGLISLLVSIVVLYITYQTWKLKIGQSVRATYGISSSIEADGPYVSKVIIENLKDKELVIFSIYLKYGANVFIDLLDIDDTYDKYNHIIPPLSTRIFELGPPIYYTCSATEVDVNKLLRNDFSLRNGKIILITNQGKVVAKNFKRGWHPIALSFKNYATLNIRPHRIYNSDSVPVAHKQTEQYIDYSSIPVTTKFIAKLKLKSGKIFDYSISEHIKYILFKNLKFTSDILGSASALRNYLIKSREENLVDFEEILEIVDFQEFIANNKAKLSPCPDDDNIVETLNSFQYYFI